MEKNSTLWRKVRLSLDMGQKEFAKKLGVGAGYISEIESGKKEPSRTLSELFRYICQEADTQTLNTNHDGEGDCDLENDTPKSSTNRYDNCEDIIQRAKLFLNISTNKDFAQIIGVSENGISTWKKRKTLNIGKILLVCEGVNSTWLLTGSGNPNMKISNETQSSTNTEKEESYRERCRELQDELIESYKKNIKQMQEIQILKYTDSVETDPTNKKYVVPDNIPNKLFDLLNKLEKFTDFSIGYSGGGWDVEGNEGHRWLQNQMDSLDVQIKDIRSMFMSDEAIEKMEKDNRRNVDVFPHKLRMKLHSSFKAKNKRPKK